MFKNIVKFKFINLAYLVSLFLASGGWIWSYAALGGNGELLVIRFNNLVGISQIGSFSDLSAVGAISLIVIVINFFISRELAKNEEFLSKLLAFATVLFSALIFIGFAAIISVN